MEDIDLDEIRKAPADLALSYKHPASKDPEHWSVGPTLRTRDSTLMARVNADALIEALQEEHAIPREDWRVSRADHWGFGWVEHLSFRAKNADGTPTSVCLFLAKWSAARADYACADDTAYSRAQYEGALPAGTRVTTPDGSGQTVSMNMRRASNGGPGTWQYAVHLDDQRVRHYSRNEVKPCD